MGIEQPDRRGSAEPRLRQVQIAPKAGASNNGVARLSMQRQRHLPRDSALFSCCDLGDSL